MIRHALSVLATYLTVCAFCLLLLAAYVWGEERRCRSLAEEGNDRWFTLCATPTNSEPPIGEVGGSELTWVPVNPEAARDATRNPSRAARHREPPSRLDMLDWHALFECESGNDPRAISPSGKYRGLAQFDLETWYSVGGVGDPAKASRAEQTARAKQLYSDRGAQPWPECKRWLR